jgi:predicted transcriptional regulator
VNTPPVSRLQAYGPMQHKTFASALTSFFAAECPHLGGERIRRALVEALGAMVEQFFPKATTLRPGQAPWITIARDEHPGYAKRITDHRLVRVVLDLVAPEDTVRLLGGVRLPALRRDAVARLFQEADAQGGCLTSAEVAVLLHISPSAVVYYIKQWEHEHGRLLPRRGTVHDLGRTLTHKPVIIRKLFLEGKSVETVCRETHHSPEAVHRYIEAFKRVLLLRRNGLSVPDIAYAIHMTPLLIAEYNRLIDQLGDENAVLKHLLQTSGKEVQ